MDNIVTVEDLQQYSGDNDLPLLPPSADIESKVILKKAISANRALAELKNKVELLPNQDMLISSIALTEAKVSSEIENIFTTDDALYKSNITSDNQLDPHTKEVKSYNKALWLGMDLIKEKSLGTSTFIKLVQTVKRNDAGIRKTTGTVIKNGNTGEIVHIPPQGEDVILGKLANLESFLYDNTGVDALIKMAILHYQFEAIHPFLDGNGRVGRIINILWLVQEGLLNRPVLFLSEYFLKHKQKYYDLLKAVTTNAEWENWIIYILDAIEETSKSTQTKVDKIISARKAFKKKLIDNFPRIYSSDLVDALFSLPYFRISDVLEMFPTIKYQTAKRYLESLSKPRALDGKEQMIEMFKVGRENIYVNKSLLGILSS